MVPGSVAGADGASELALVVARQLDLLDPLARAGRVDHVALPDVDAHVGLAAVEEEQVALDRALPGDLVLNRTVDLLCRTGKLHPGLAPGGARQSRAVSRAGTVAAVAVRVADLLVGERDGGGGALLLPRLPRRGGGGGRHIRGRDRRGRGRGWRRWRLLG